MALGAAFLLTMTVAAMAGDAPTVTGTVLLQSGQSADAAPDQEVPAVGFPLTVDGPQGRTVVFTDSEGNWALYDLPEGEYSIEPILGRDGQSADMQTFEVEQKGFVQRLFSDQEAVTIELDAMEIQSNRVNAAEQFILNETGIRR